MEMINMKIELAKQTGLNEALQEEIKQLKENHCKEICLLQETLKMQQNIIDEMQERDVITAEKFDISETELEVSLDGFEIIQEEAEEQTEDLARLIARLSLEVEEIKTQLQEEKESLEAEKSKSKALEIEKKSTEEVNKDLRIVNDHLSRDILELKVEHEMTLYKLEMVISALQKKVLKLKKSNSKKDIQISNSKVELEKVNSIILQDYEVIC